ncbi:sialidase family protein [Novipirellula maiorica]|nr:sialidase family protein [Rhodopirellula maiorica]
MRLIWFAVVLCSWMFVGGEHLLGQDLTITRGIVAEGDAQWDWTQARTGVVSGEDGFALTTMSRTSKVGAHGYHDLYFTTTRDHGRTWNSPRVLPTLKRTRQVNGYEVVAGDVWPNWHTATKRLLLTGKTFNFAGGTKENYLKEKVFYAVIDPATLQSSPLRTVAMPDRDHEGKPIIAPNAGCHQLVMLSNGDILLPIRYQKSQYPRRYTTIVARCRFDGETLTYVEHGSEHTLSTNRGLYEPSVTQFSDEFFLTMRADDGAYVAKGRDGIHFSEAIAWTFDDGKPLGSYNTQQHWVTVGGKLYLLYTRRGADNDHIMRHRAPLFIAEVDPQRLTVLRATEQVLVPEDHATLGNSGVCQINQDEAWVTVAEGLVSHGQRKGENNRVHLIRIQAD